MILDNLQVGTVEIVLENDSSVRKVSIGVKIAAVRFRILIPKD